MNKKAEEQMTLSGWKVDENRLSTQTFERRPPGF
jgi:hypothetical protein